MAGSEIRGQRVYDCGCCGDRLKRQRRCTHTLADPEAAARIPEGPRRCPILDVEADPWLLHVLWCARWEPRYEDMDLQTAQAVDYLRSRQLAETRRRLTAPRE